MPIITCYVMVAFTENQVAFPLFFSNLPCILWALKPMKKDDIFKTLTPTAKIGFACFVHPVFHPAISYLETFVGQRWLPGPFVCVQYWVCPRCESKRPTTKRPRQKWWKSFNCRRKDCGSVLRERLVSLKGSPFYEEVTWPCLQGPLSWVIFE